jgi:hypothetical protein
MGRSCGGDVEIFQTMEEAKRHVEKLREENKKNRESYECDGSDSGRGYAAENDGGFTYFQVYTDQRTFSSKEEAKRQLSLHEDQVGNDSIIYVLGTFKTLDATSSKAKEV